MIGYLAFLKKSILSSHITALAEYSMIYAVFILKMLQWEWEKPLSVLWLENWSINRSTSGQKKGL